MDACINNGTAQHQEAEMMSDVLNSLKSDIFFADFVTLEVKKIWFIKTTCTVQR